MGVSELAVDLGSPADVADEVLADLDGEVGPPPLAAVAVVAIVVAPGAGAPGRRSMPLPEGGRRRSRRGRRVSVCRSHRAEKERGGKEGA